ncbi:MAG: hypothetical protein JST77_16685 [Acidobacteria bacterium]|nr:hypothetical protein [Acidobacteriota bacterium]
MVRIPVIAAGGFNTFPFNSTVDLTSIPNPTDSHIRIELANVFFNQPLVISGFTELQGIPQTETSFSYTPLGSFGGVAHPLVLANGNTHGGVHIRRIKFSANATGQSSIVMDQVVGSGGEVGFILEDNAYSGTFASAVVVKGGFDFWFTRGVCGSGGTWDSPPCLRFTNASTYLNTATQSPGRIYIEKTAFSGGTSVQIDNIPNLNSTGGGNIFMTGTLHESNAGPVLRMAIGAGQATCCVKLFAQEVADQANGLHQPILELTGTQPSQIIVENAKGPGPNPTILGGGAAGPVCINNVFVLGCGQSPSYNISGSNTSLDGGVLGAVNGGSMGYLMPTPAAPASCVVSSGGSVPVGTINYFIVATDRSPISFSPFAGMTLLGPSCSVSTTGGNQTVTVTRPALPPGAVGWLVWRGGAEAQMPASCGTPIPASTTTFIDTFSFGCGASAPSTNTAFVSGINSQGINTGLMTINGEGLTAAPRAEQNVFLPGALTATWTGATWTLDRALTITRIQVQAKTAPSGCTTNAVVRLTDGTTPVNVTVSAAANDSGAIAQNYAAGASITLSVQTAATGCTTSPADANVVVQYRMQ